MSKLTQTLLIGAVAITAGLAGWLTRPAPSAPPALDSQAAASAGATLLALTLPDLDGVAQPLSQWQGKIIVVNFWATWCPPCIKEIPDFVEASHRHADAPVQFVGISLDKPEAVTQFRERFDIPYPLLIGTQATLGLAKEFGNTAGALPFTVIINRRGEVAEVKLGTLNTEELERKILAQLSQ
ncbi:MAG: TlpA disulfide reductase family protein [Rhodocyclaceae bacterium]